MSVKLLEVHYLEFLTLPGGCTGLSESTLVKIQHCWKPRVAAQLLVSNGKSQLTMLTPQGSAYK